MAIADSTGNVIANYSYNEWGEVTVNATGNNLTIANLNPIRYRGYYYDSETGYYYLQSRYYKSDWCRFINSDLPTYADEKKDEINGMNLFSYCGNDAINYVDPTGFKKEKKKKKSKEDKVRELLNNFLVSNVKVFNTKQLGVVKLYLEKKNFYEKLYEATLISKSKTWKILAEQAKATFKKRFSRDIIFNNHVLRKEIKYHVLGYLYSRDYNVNCPKVFLIKAKLEYPNDKKSKKNTLKNIAK